MINSPQGVAELAQRMVKTLSKAFSDGIKTLGNIAKNAVVKAVAVVKAAQLYVEMNQLFPDNANLREIGLIINILKL